MGLGLGLVQVASRGVASAAARLMCGSLVVSCQAAMGIWDGGRGKVGGLCVCALGVGVCGLGVQGACCFGGSNY